MGAEAAAQTESAALNLEKVQAAEAQGLAVAEAHTEAVATALVLELLGAGGHVVAGLVGELEGGVEVATAKLELDVAEHGVGGVGREAVNAVAD